MSVLQESVAILAGEFGLDVSTMDEVEEWLASKERAGDDPKPWAEGMCLKLKQAQAEGNGKSPVGLMLWCIRQGKGKDDYRSLAPTESYGASKARKVCQAIADRSAYSYSQVMEMHQRGGIPWPVMNIYSSQIVERAFQTLREHAQELGFEDIRTTKRTPAYHDGEWSFEPQPVGFDPSSISVNPRVAELVAARAAELAGGAS